MGAGQSISGGLPTKEGLRVQTQGTELITNSIFQWMMSNAEFQDLLKLSNQKYCKEYVFLTQQAISTFMKQIQLNPKVRTGSNILYFEPVKKIAFQDDAAEEKIRPREKAYRDSLCGELAFFYVRIFQVFGALALTVIDSLPETTGTAQNYGAALFPKQALMQQGQPQGRGPPPLFRQYAQSGGRPPAAIVGRIDTDINDAIGEYLFASNGIGDNEILVISNTQPGRTAMDPRKTTGTLFFYVSESPNVAYHPRSGVTVECDISIINKKESNFDLLIRNVTLTKANDVIPLGIENSVAFKKTARQGTYAPEFQNKTVVDILTTYLSAVSKDSDRVKGLNDILGKREVGAVAKGDVRVDEGGIPEGMKYTTIAQYMRLRPKAYCVARAIQLLSPTLLSGVPKDAQIKSGICLTNGIPGLESSVPHYDSSITQNAPGLRMLHQLFYDILDKNTPNISASTKDKYNEFLRIMKVVYTPDSADATLPQSLDRIQSKALPGCTDKSRKDREIAITNAQTLRNVRQQIGQLLQTQIRHTAEVAKFLKGMFLIDKYGQIVGLSPALQKGGLPAVNVFAERARILLTDYYKKCEGFYRVGALAVLEGPDNRILEARR